MQLRLKKNTEVEGRADRVTRALWHGVHTLGSGDLRSRSLTVPWGSWQLAILLKRLEDESRERPASLSMAGVTVFIDAGLLELERIGRAVRIVAVSTSQLAFAHGMCDGAHELARFSASDTGRKLLFPPAD